MNNELKVSFYLKRESRLEKVGSRENVAYPIIGKIIIRNSIAQFSTKLKVEERFWNVKSGRNAMCPPLRLLLRMCRGKVRHWH
jgi:hypothetical protein